MTTLDLRERMFLFNSGKEMRRERKGHIKMVLREIGCDGVDQIYLAQGWVQFRALVNKVMNFHSTIKCCGISSLCYLGR